MGGLSSRQCNFTSHIFRLTNLKGHIFLLDIGSVNSLNLTIEVYTTRSFFKEYFGNRPCLQSHHQVRIWNNFRRWNCHYLHKQITNPQCNHNCSGKGNSLDMPSQERPQIIQSRLNRHPFQSCVQKLQPRL
uniref:Uncharacterized protein n=1 Tax=Opuntia streptacantha TaxID=393608 RepID=A0A7C9ANJ3_OPUST